MSRLDYQLLKTHIMPRVHAVCMRTTTAAVRVHAIAFMTAAVQRLDKEECAAMIDTVTQVRVYTHTHTHTHAHTHAYTHAHTHSADVSTLLMSKGRKGEDECMCVCVCVCLFASHR